MTEKNLSRQNCSRCSRPTSHCLCSYVRVVVNRTKILILQHPDEARHPLNTGRLVALGLTNVELWVGESFAQLEEVISAVDMSLLLFPAQAQSVVQPLAPIDPEVTSLVIVPDGTWRKVRKMIQMNPILRTLPHLSLPIGEPSQYRIRRAQEAAAVATIEAVVRTLTILEPEQDFSPVLDPFEAMVEQQIQAMGMEVYRRNYHA